jgi:hypothetical protein
MEHLHRGGRAGRGTTEGETAGKGTAAAEDDRGDPPETTFSSRRRLYVRAMQETDPGGKIPVATKLQMTVLKL